jgi:hypothetical protein
MRPCGSPRWNGLAGIDPEGVLPLVGAAAAKVRQLTRVVFRDVLRQGDEFERLPGFAENQAQVRARGWARLGSGNKTVAIEPADGLGPVLSSVRRVQPDRLAPIRGRMRPRISKDIFCPDARSIQGLQSEQDSPQGILVRHRRAPSFGLRHGQRQKRGDAFPEFGGQDFSGRPNALCTLKVWYKGFCYHFLIYFD